MSRQVRRLQEARDRRAAAARKPVGGEVPFVGGPFTERQAELVAVEGHRSLAAYRAMQDRLRLGNGAQRLLETARDWRVFMPVPPTLWVVEKDHFRGFRMLSLGDLESFHRNLRAGTAMVGGVETRYPGSLLVYLARNEHEVAVSVEYIFEHDGLEIQERHTYEAPESWHHYTREKAADPWTEIDDAAPAWVAP